MALTVQQRAFYEQQTCYIDPANILDCLPPAMDGAQDSNSSHGSVDNPEDILSDALTLAAGQPQQAPIPAASAPDLVTDGQQSTPQDPSSDMPSTSQHTGPVAQQQQLPIPQRVSGQPAIHTSASHQQSALITPERPNGQPPSGIGLEPDSAHSEEAAALNTASTIVNVFAQRLGIDPQQLDQQQRVSLLGSNVAALGVYLNFLNHRENHRYTTCHTLPDALTYSCQSATTACSYCSCMLSWNMMPSLRAF